MSIQSTKDVTRNWATERIRLIYDLASRKEYRDLEMVSFETDCDLQSFVDSFIPFDISIIEKWTNKMIERKLDEPFFRESIFDNYFVD